jgi:hypothetical protein
MNGASVNLLDKFVFNGRPLTLNSLELMRKQGYLPILVKMAKRYNDPAAIDASLSSLEKKASGFISDARLIKETPAYKWFDSIFALKDSDMLGNPDRNCLNLISGYRTPYGLFDEITPMTPFYVTPCVGIRAGEIKVKTLDRLADQVRSYLTQMMTPWRRQGPIQEVNSLMMEYLVAQFGQPITKEDLIEIHRPQIEYALIQKFIEILKNPSLSRELGALVKTA